MNHKTSFKYGKSISQNHEWRAYWETEISVLPAVKTSEQNDKTGKEEKEESWFYDRMEGQETPRQSRQTQKHKWCEVTTILYFTRVKA